MIHEVARHKLDECHGYTGRRTHEKRVERADRGEQLPHSDYDDENEQLPYARQRFLLFYAEQIFFMRREHRAFSVFSFAFLLHFRPPCVRRL